MNFESKFDFPRFFWSPGMPPAWGLKSGCLFENLRSVAEGVQILGYLTSSSYQIVPTIILQNISIFHISGNIFMIWYTDSRQSSWIPWKDHFQKMFFSKNAYTAFSSLLFLKISWTSSQKRRMWQKTKATISRKYQNIWRTASDLLVLEQYINVNIVERDNPDKSCKMSVICEEPNSIQPRTSPSQQKE